MALVLGIVGVVGIVAIGALFGPAVYQRWQEARRGASAPAVVPQPPPPRSPAPLDVSSDQLHLDYAANEVAADQRYRGRLLRVTGAVKAIRRDIFEAPYLELWTTSEFENVDAQFDRAWADELARVKVGDHVAVQCVGAGMTINSPQLRSCSVKR